MLWFRFVEAGHLLSSQQQKRSWMTLRFVYNGAPPSESRTRRRRRSALRNRLAGEGGAIFEVRCRQGRGCAVLCAARRGVAAHPGTS